MSQNYILEWSDGEQVIWRIRDVGHSVRIFEDGFVAMEHAAIAEKLANTGGILIKAFDDYQSAYNWIKSRLTEVVWFHHFTLALGYHDQCPKEGISRG